MSLTQEADWPQLNDLVVAVVDEIVDHGVYVRLESHQNKKGYLPISEISQGWVTDIRRFVNPGQRVVLRVIRVNPSKGHVDLSLKRVAQSERTSILKAWKRRKRLLKTLEGFFESEKAFRDYRSTVLEKVLSVQDPLSVLEKAASDGPAVLINLGLDEKLAGALAEYAKKIVKLKEYSGSVKFTLFTTSEGGADKIRDVLMNVKKFLDTKAVKPKVYVVAAPKYAAEFVCDKPKLINSLTKELAIELQKAAKQNELEVSIED
ncbi:MAG: S1 RNA-binding domain-containing protein [Thermoprotei archaeon]